MHLSLLPSLRVIHSLPSMLSLSNNLLLHRNFNPKLDLVPKKQSQEISQLQHQITTKKTTNKP